MKEKIAKFKLVISLLLVISFVFPIIAQALVRTYELSPSNPPGFLQGIWHGLLAPYALIAQLFIKEVVIYASPNAGWNYNAGFIIGILGSVHIGGICAIISYLAHVNNIQLF